MCAEFLCSLEESHQDEKYGALGDAYTIGLRRVLDELKAYPNVDPELIYNKIRSCPSRMFPMGANCGCRGPRGPPGPSSQPSIEI